MGSPGSSKKYNKRLRTPPSTNVQSTPRRTPHMRMDVGTSESSASPSPISPSPKDLTTLYALVPKVLLCLTPTEEDNALRLTLINKLKEWIRTYGPVTGCHFEPYGSYSTGLYTRSGDVDLSVSHSDKKILLKLYYLMRQYAETFLDVQYIEGKKLHLLRFEMMGNGTRLPFDLTFYEKSGKMTSLLMTEIKNIDERFQKLVLLVKGWVTCHGINVASKGGLKSYALYLLIIYHCQTTQPPILPPLKKLCTPQVMKMLQAGEKGWKQIFEKNVESCGVKKCGVSKNQQKLPELFFQFIIKYRRIRKQAKDEYLDVMDGQWVKKAGKMRHRQLWIKEPFDKGENLARTVKKDNLKHIGAMFRKTYTALITGDMDEIVKNVVPTDLVQLVQKSESDQENTISPKSKPSDDDSRKGKSIDSPGPSAVCYDNQNADIPSTDSSRSSISDLISSSSPDIDPRKKFRSTYPIELSYDDVPSSSGSSSVSVLIPSCSPEDVLGLGGYLSDEED